MAAFFSFCLISEAARFRKSSIFAKAKEVEESKKKKVETQKLICKKARDYAQEVDSVEAQARLEGGFYVSPEAKLLFIVRIRGINDMHPTTKKILQF
ncbi:hypothetical protein ACP275_10G000700 [Erythranthe tilingii]